MVPQRKLSKMKWYLKGSSQHQRQIKLRNQIALSLCDMKTGWMLVLVNMFHNLCSELALNRFITCRREYSLVSTGNRPLKRTHFSGPDCRVGESLHDLYLVSRTNIYTFFTLPAWFRDLKLNLGARLLPSKRSSFNLVSKQHLQIPMG